MKGALVTAAVLIGLQVALSTSLPDLLGAAAAPAEWARKWMDPGVALIPNLAAAATGPSVGATVGGTGKSVNTNLPPPTSGGRIPPTWLTP